jgi:phage tail sheath gpL-like
MGVSPSAVSRVCGVETIFKNFNTGKAQSLPQRLAIVGIGNDDADYSLKKFEVPGSASAVAARYGYGSPLHLMAKQFFPQAGTAAEFPVTIYPLKKPDQAQPAAGAIGVSGTATANGSGKIFLGGIAVEFAGLKGATAGDVLNAIKSAIDGSLDSPAKTGTVASSSLPVTSKWSGASSNKISLEAEINIPGIVVELTQFSGGALDPDVTPALTKIGPVWETMILNGFDYSDTARLDKYQEYGEGRWAVLEKKPLLICHGCADTLDVRGEITDPRKTDAMNFLIVSVGSRELPCVIAAKGLINDVMTTANKNPARGYKGLLTGLHSGDDEVQENDTLRNASVRKGSSTNIKNGSVAELNDIITFYHPESEGNFPSKRYVVDLVKLQNVVFNVRLIMEADEMKGAPLVTDKDVTTNPDAKAPKDIKTAFYNLADSLALKAIIVTADFTKKNMSVKTDTENPKRINVIFPVKLSGNIEISSTDIYFGFYLGGE